MREIKQAIKLIVKEAGKIAREKKMGETLAQKYRCFLQKIKNAL